LAELVQGAAPQGEEATMKYFTPELIVAYGSDDPETWKEGQRRWEAACARYSTHLASLRNDLPPGLRLIEDNYRLHDAVVRGMGRRGGAFFIMLQLDAPPQSLLSCTYSLVDEPAITHGALPPEFCSTGGQVDWQYDEVEKGARQPPTWRQSILLSNGWEVALHFRDVQVEEIQPLLPAPRTGAGSLPATGLPQPA
jgi:hypothetical protein